MKPYYSDATCTLYLGDCRYVVPELGIKANVIIADPSYEQTKFQWDQWAPGWPLSLCTGIKPDASLWCFGALRVFMDFRDEFAEWEMAQDLVWEKHNGSSLHNDRFRRVHELCVHFYRGKWSNVYKKPLFTHDGVKKTIRRTLKPAHYGLIGKSIYSSEDGGPRLKRSVIKAPSPHGKAINGTQKPEAFVRDLIEYSCPTDGLILEPFLGGGTACRVAKDMGIRSIGIEGDEAQLEKTAKRISQEVLFPH